MRQSCQNAFVTEKLKMATAVSATESAVRRPVPKRRTRRAVSSEETIVQQEMMIEMRLCAATGAPRSTCMAGHAVPSSESGRPSEMNVR